MNPYLQTPLIDWRMDEEGNVNPYIPNPYGRHAGMIAGQPPKFKPQPNAMGQLPMPAPAQAPAPQPEQPIGLLGKLKKGAEGIGSDQILMALGSGMLGMSNDPRLQQLGMAGFGQVAERSKARKAQEANNRTIDMLRQRGVSEDDLAVLETNPELLMAYAKEALMPKKKESKTTDDITEYEYAVASGAFKGSLGDWLDRNQEKKDPKDMTPIEAGLRKEFTGLAPVKNFSEQAKAYGRIVQAAGDSTGAGDIAVVFSYMKVLDPTSVVREGEFATAESASGVPEQVRNLYNKIVSGERLPDVQRVQFVNMAKKLYDDSKAQYDSLRNQYFTYASRAGVPDPEAIYPDFTWKGDASAFAPQEKPEDMDQDVWELLLKFYKPAK